MTAARWGFPQGLTDIADPPIWHPAVHRHSQRTRIYEAEEGGTRRVATVHASINPVDIDRAGVGRRSARPRAHGGRFRAERMARRRDLPAVPARSSLRGQGVVGL